MIFLSQFLKMGSITRYTALMILLFSGAGCGIPFVSTGPGLFGRDNSDPLLRIMSQTISPDGDRVVFYYAKRQSSQRTAGLGMLDVRTGAVFRIPNPPGKELRDPRFFWDPEKIFVNVYSERQEETGILIAKYNLVNHDLGYVTKNNDSRARLSGPTYTKDRRNIIFIKQNYRDSSIWMYDKVGVEKQIIGGLDAFSSISPPFLLSDHNFYFSASTPRRKDLQEALSQIGISNVSSVIYKSSMDGKVEIAFPEFQAKPLRGLEYISNVVSSFDGELAIGISLSRINRSPEGHPFNYDVFQLLNSGELKQITTLGGQFYNLSISKDGSFISFVHYKKTKKWPDLVVFNKNIGTINNINLFEKIMENQEF